MKVFQTASVAGRTIWISIGVPSGVHTRSRAMKRNVTREQVRENNDRLAVRNLTLLLNENFDHTCCHYSLSYETEPSVEQAAKDRKDFIRRMKRAIPDLKYVAVTEYTNVRLHHHIVLNTTDVDLVEEIWGKGIVRPAVLSRSGEYSGLADYLVKETNKTFRDPEGVHKHRWTASRNLKRPEFRRKEVSVRKLEEDPEPLKGYYIPSDKLRRYTHPVTGLEYLEYFMVAIDKPRKPRLGGKKVSGKEYFKVDEEDEQEDVFALLGMEEGEQ